MKKIYILILAVSMFVLSNAQNAQIINGSFEQWNSFTVNSQTIDTALNWTNYSIIDGGTSGDILVKTAEKTSDFNLGTYAVKMNTYNNTGVVVPGIMQLGDFSLLGQNYKFSGGQKFSSKPKGFSAFIKYSPAIGDTGFVFCYMTKWNGSNQDTIAVSIYPLFDSIKNYTQIEAPFLYKDGTDSICDTINIILSSSNIFSPKLGSTLYADDILLDYSGKAYSTLALPATDTNANSFTANWIKSPVSNYYYIDVAYDSLFTNIVDGYNNKLLHFVPVKFNSTDYTLSQVITIPSKTNYYYRIRVKYGDTAVSENSNTIAVHYSVASKIKEISEFSDFRIYNKILILFNVPLNSTIQIFDINGKILFSERNNNSTLNIPFINSGIYILKVISANKIQTLKFKIN